MLLVVYCDISRGYLVEVCFNGLLLISNTGYFDADWASHSIDCRSINGCYTFLGGNLVTWRIKKQKVVARAGPEAFNLSFDDD